MTYESKNKVFLITGGASGLGALMTREFLKEGAKQIAVLDIAKDAGEALEKELNTKHGKNSVKFFQCDVTDEDQLFNAFETVVKENGQLDVVINNAGIMNDGRHIYKKSIALNVTALITSTIKALEVMGVNKGGKGGTVINISSVAGLCQSPILPIYFATKSAVLQFSNCIGSQVHYERTGVRVITVCFSATDTPLIDQNNYKGFDDDTTTIATTVMAKVPVQKPESAIRGVLEAFRIGESGSTWLAANDKEPIEISKDVKEAYSIMSKEFTPK